jgi:hypothetical protein
MYASTPIVSASSASNPIASCASRGTLGSRPTGRFPWPPSPEAKRSKPTPASPVRGDRPVIECLSLACLPSKDTRDTGNDPGARRTPGTSSRLALSWLRGEGACPEIEEATHDVRGRRPHSGRAARGPAARPHARASACGCVSRQGRRGAGGAALIGNRKCEPHRCEGHCLVSGHGLQVGFRTWVTVPSRMAACRRR